MYLPPQREKSPILLSTGFIPVVSGWDTLLSFRFSLPPPLMLSKITLLLEYVMYITSAIIYVTLTAFNPYILFIIKSNTRES